MRYQPSDLNVKRGPGMKDKNEFVIPSLKNTNGGNLKTVPFATSRNALSENPQIDREEFVRSVINNTSCRIKLK